MRTNLLAAVAAVTLSALPSAAEKPQPKPLVLEAEPGIGSGFTGMSGEPGGAWVVEFGAMSEFGGARGSMLRLDGKWIPLGNGELYAWKDWIVADDLVAAAVVGEDDASAIHVPPKGATRLIGRGTDDEFARHVTIIERSTGRRFDSPWDTFSPFPLGGGESWLLWRCPSAATPDGQVKEQLELVLWQPQTGKTKRVGALPGEVRGSCEQTGSALTQSVMVMPPGGFASQSYAYLPVLLPDSSGTGAIVRVIVDGAERWLHLDAKGKTSAAKEPAKGAELSAAPAPFGSPLKPFTSIADADLGDPNVPQVSLSTSDGRPVYGRIGKNDPVPLTPPMIGRFALHDGLLFSQEGAFRWPKKEPRPVPVTDQLPGQRR